LHEPIKNLTDSNEHYFIEINEFIETNKKELQLDNPDVRDQEDASYYTKSKMMFDISDFYLEKEDKGKKHKL